MNDSNSENKKHIKNQLFSASVTGGTLEDFSQHAILFPVQDLPPPITNTPSEIPLCSTQNPVPIQENLCPVQLQENRQPGCQDQQTSQFSSVFPPLSHTLGFKETQNFVAPGVTYTSTGFETIIGENNDPIPLIPADTSNSDVNYLQSTFNRSSLKSNAAPPPQDSSSNLYRRSGLKRPAYAQVPGLVSSKVTTEQTPIPYSQPSQSTSWPNFQSAQHSEQFVQAVYPSAHSSTFPPPSNSPLSSSTSSASSNTPLSSSNAPTFLTPTTTKKVEISNTLQFVSSENSYVPPTPFSTVPLKPKVYTSATDLHAVEQTSAILTPIASDSISGTLPPLTNISNSTSAFPTHSSRISTPNSGDTRSTSFFQSPAYHLPSHTSGLVNPSPSIANLPLFNPSSFSSLHISSPVMAGVSESEIRTANGMATLSNPSQVSYGNQNEAPCVSSVYRQIYHHWFFKKVIEGKTLWQPFSMIDSLALEEAFTSPDISPERVVATDGGRYDVNILRRERYPVYWTATPTEVRRCSWFYKRANDGRFVPYEENVATMLESEFRTAFETKEWHRKVELANGETVVFHGPDVLVLFPATQSPDAWGNTPQTQPKPRVVKRGLDEFDIEDGEPTNIDHLLFVVHGIGSVCDLKFRSVEEVVDEFRSIAFQLVNSHYRSSCDNGVVNRVEVLPISWHSRLHSEDTGVDKNLKNITLESIPRLREFTNDTLLDILFFTSPIYSQTIISSVGTELNRLFELFKQRNPSFNGSVSLSGHSLGSIILFDLLSHQKTPDPEKEHFDNTEDVVPPLKKPHPKDRRLSRRISYMMSEAGTGQPELHYPHLNFNPIAFFALGSPIGMFITVRGLDKLGDDFALPTCSGFFNIFHPYDPVAYRIESLINPQLTNLKPVLIPHHKGRKRMHLELKETMTRVGADLKQKVIDSMKNTWNTFFQIALFGRHDNSPSVNLEAEVDKVIEKQIAEEEAKEQTVLVQSVEDQSTDLYLGVLNKGRRIDYVLQEAPFEFFNEYIFALTSHVCYWESEDTILLILKEIYNTMGITSDTQVPQQTMTIERPSTSPKPSTTTPLPSNQAVVMGMDPTAPMTSNTNIGPPPISGFVRKA